MSALLALLAYSIREGALIDLSGRERSRWACRYCYEEVAMWGEEEMPSPFPHHPDCIWPNIAKLAWMVGLEATA